jgi:hypothetical protein
MFFRGSEPGSWHLDVCLRPASGQGKSSEVQPGPAKSNTFFRKKRLFIFMSEERLKMLLSKMAVKTACPVVEGELFCCVCD